MQGLILHCGARHISREELYAYPTPEPQGPWHQPIHHADFIEQVEGQLLGYDYHITDEAFGISADGAKFFGVMQLREHGGEGHGFIVGLRGSHDRSMSRGISMGSRTFVCDNLAFSGDVVFQTRHTTNIDERLPVLIHAAVERIAPMAEYQNDCFECYKDKYLKPIEADAAITEIIRRGIINPSEVGKLINHWDEPPHEEFEEPNVYRLFNAATEVLKPRNPDHPRLPYLAPKTQALHQVCNELALAA